MNEEENPWLAYKNEESLRSPRQYPCRRVYFDKPFHAEEYDVVTVELSSSNSGAPVARVVRVTPIQEIEAKK